MMNCSDNVLGPGGAGMHGVSNDPPDSGETSVEAKIWHTASRIESGSEVGDGGAGDGRLEDGEEGRLVVSKVRRGRCTRGETVGRRRCCGLLGKGECCGSAM